MNRGSMKAWTAALLAAGLATPARADVSINPNAGTTSANFLEVAVGGRPVGMGEAFTAVSGDANGILWNPASIADIRTHVITGSDNESFLGIRSNYAAYVQPLSPTSSGNSRSLALSVLTLVPPSQQERFGTNESDAFNPISTPDGTFGAYDLALGLTYAQQLGSLWTAGGTFQLIRESIDSQNAQTFAVNLGLLRKTSLPGLTLGASMLNFGPGNAFVTTYPLPLTFRVGVAYRPFVLSSAPDKLTFTFDVSQPNDDYMWFAGGAEFTPIPAFTIRAGYRQRLYGDPLGALSGLRIGAGIKLADIHLDYAFAPGGDLGSQNRISITIPWGKAPLPPAPKAEAAQAAPLPAMPTAATPALELPPPAPAPALAAVPQGAATSGYAVQMRPIALTAQGAIYEVKASTSGAAATVQDAGFKAVLPGPTTVSFDVAESEQPGGFDVLPSTCAFYRLLELSESPRGPLRAVTLRLSIDGAWLKALGSTPEKLALFRIEDGKAVPQPTIFKEEKDGRDLYEAMPDMLGQWFIVGAEKPKDAKP